MSDVQRDVRELASGEAMNLLASVRLGRIVFTQHGLPAIRPVNHVVDDGRVIIRSHEGTAMVSAGTVQTVVAYEADDIDPAARTGWSVIVTGTASLVTEPDEIGRYRQRLRPWVSREMDYVIVIDPAEITGFRLITGKS